MKICNAKINDNIFFEGGLFPLTLLLVGWGGGANRPRFSFSALYGKRLQMGT